jgi:hypothetical protein
MVLGELYEAGNEFQTLKKHAKPLTPDERKKCMDTDTVWHFSHLKSPTPAVWKSIHPKSGKTTFITNTHRAYNTAPTLKGAIGRYHTFIKSTA